MPITIYAVYKECEDSYYGSYIDRLFISKEAAEKWVELQPKQDKNFYNYEVSAIEVED